MKWTQLPKEGVQIAFVQSKKPLGLLIRFGMWLFQLLRLKKFPEPSYNHTEIIVDGWVIGAIMDGITSRSARVAYMDNHVNDIKVFQISSEPQDIKKIREFCQREDHKKYQFSNFWHHIQRIFNKPWKGPKNNNKYYCIEFTATALNELFPNLIEQPWQINPYEFMQICEEKYPEVL